jgi:hypothetical protein
MTVLPVSHVQVPTPPTQPPRPENTPPGGNQYYHGTEEWHACESGRRDVQAMIALGREIGEDNEDHLVMLGQAYIAGVRAERAKHRSGCT